MLHPGWGARSKFCVHLLLCSLSPPKIIVFGPHIIIWLSFQYQSCRPFWNNFSCWLVHISQNYLRSTSRRSTRCTTWRRPFAQPGHPSPSSSPSQSARSRRHVHLFSESWTGSSRRKGTGREAIWWGTLKLCYGVNIEGSYYFDIYFSPWLAGCNRGPLLSCQFCLARSVR